MTKMRELINLTDEYTTVNGRKAGVYSVGNGGSCPVHGWVEGSGGSRRMRSWPADGHYRDDDPLNLVPVKKTVTVTICGNVYPDGVFRPKFNKLEADSHACSDPFAYIERTFEVEEGEGLE